MNCVISRRARAVIESELGRFPDTETGGLLLGYSDPERGIRILEATDSGYRDVIHEAGSFQYDFAYEEHVCSILCGLYQPPLQLVGVWHKHNSVHSDNTIPFSGADEDMHRQLMENDCPCISILFEKCSAPDETVRYKAGVFLLSVGGAHRNITDSTVWGESLCDEPFTEIQGNKVDHRMNQSGS